MVQLSEATRKGAADAIATLIEDCVVRLFQNVVSPAPGTPVGDFTECDFNGYLAVTSTSILTVRDDGTGDWTLVPVGAFSYIAGAGITGPQTAYGLFVTNTGGTVLYASEAFDTPFTFTTEDDGLVLDPIQLRVPYSM